MAEYLFKIGTSSSDSDLVNIEDLLGGDVMAPKASFFDYSDYITLADGSVRGVGFPFCKWEYGYIDFDARSALKTYCPGASVSVYIQTQTNEKDSNDEELYQKFSAVMVWPQNEGELRENTGKRIELPLLFKKLVKV